jgi:hypothetical protein
MNALDPSTQSVKGDYLKILVRHKEALLKICKAAEEKISFRQGDISESQERLAIARRLLKGKEEKIEILARETLSQEET